MVKYNGGSNGGNALERIGDDLDLLRAVVALAEHFAATNRTRSTRQRKRDLTA